MFGRGGEEMDFLQEKGIQVQVVPGMSMPCPQQVLNAFYLSFSYNACELSVPLQAL